MMIIMSSSEHGSRAAGAEKLALSLGGPGGNRPSGGWTGGRPGGRPNWMPAWAWTPLPTLRAESGRRTGPGRRARSGRPSHGHGTTVRRALSGDSSFTVLLSVQPGLARAQAVTVSQLSATVVTRPRAQVFAGGQVHGPRLGSYYEAPPSRSQLVNL